MLENVSSLKRKVSQLRTIPDGLKMLGLEDKDFKEAIIIIFDEIKYDGSGRRKKKSQPRNRNYEKIK